MKPLQPHRYMFSAPYLSSGSVRESATCLAQVQRMTQVVIAGNKKRSPHFECLDTSNEATTTPSIHVLCSVLVFGKCSRIMNMSGTGAENDPGCTCWKPKSVMTHWLPGHQQWSYPNPHLNICSAPYFTSGSVRESATCLAQVQRMTQVVIAGNKKRSPHFECLDTSNEATKTPSLQFLWSVHIFGKCSRIMR
jgi:RNase P protein component